MVSFLIGSIVTLVTFYIALIYSSVTIGLLGFSEAVLILSAFLFLLYMRSRIQATVKIPISVADVGGKVSIHLNVENRSRIPVMRIHYHIRSGNLFERKLKVKWQAGESVYYGKNVYYDSFYPESVGNYVLELDRIKIYDLTGLFYMKKRVYKTTSVLVLPEPASVEVRISERTRNFYGDSDIYDDFHAGHDSSEIFDIREFREGDKIQRIHWKLSAKTDSLLVREDSQPSACPLVFCLDNWEGKKKRAGQWHKRYLTVVAGIVFSLMDLRCPHYVAWYSIDKQEVVRIRVDDEESYYLFLTSYMKDCYAKAPMELQQMYKEKFRFDHPMYWMELAADMKLTLDGSVIAELGGKNWKDKLAKLEIIL